MNLSIKSVMELEVFVGNGFTGFTDNVFTGISSNGFTGFLSLMSEEPRFWKNLVRNNLIYYKFSI